MKTETKSLVLSMIVNFFISLVKIISGLLYGLSSLIADGVQTFTDFVTDVFALLGAKISKKRPTKVHPFGFGRMEYITNLLIGIIVIIIGIFILISSFKSESAVPSLSIVIILLLVLVIKGIMVLYLMRQGKKINSTILLTGAKESLADIYATTGVIIIAIILQSSNKFPILEYADLVGSILISLLIIKTGIPIIKQNILNLLGEIEVNENTLNEVSKNLNTFKQINKHTIELIKYGGYYKAHLVLELDPSMTLKKINNLEKKIIKVLKSNKNLKIKYINIDVVPELNR